jgi:ribonuclease E
MNAMRDPSLGPDDFHSARDETELEYRDEFDEYAQEELELDEELEDEDEDEDEDEWDDEFEDEDHEDDDVAARKPRREDWE